MTQAESTAAALRDVARAAAESVGGGLALVLVLPGDAPSGTRLPTLRASFGFDSQDEARAAAAALAPGLRDAIAAGKPRIGRPLPAFGARGAGAFLLVPLLWQKRSHGALAVACPGPAGDRELERLGALAGPLALQLDHAALAERCERLQAQLADRERAADEKSDELLKLSESLFAQDVELLRSHEKLGKIEKLKNDFIEKMSRELRTPLNSIIEAIISVLANENDALSEGAKSGLRAALDDGTAFLRTLQNILDLWRIKQGELPVEVQDVSFREVVDEAIFSVQDTLGDKPVLIEKQLEEPFPKLKTDVAKINQILFLLLDNAAKFTLEGKIEIRARVRDGELQCEVEDSGIGICPDDRQFLFEEFYQVDEMESSRYRGAGLGLTLVRDLLILLGGSITVTSEVGRGSRFGFRIPVQVI